MTEHLPKIPCERCPVVTLPKLKAEFTCLCGAKFGPGNQPQPVRANVTHHGPRLIDWTARRYNECKKCEHNTGHRCGLLVAIGKPGILFHPKGVPNESAKCPDGRWVSRTIEPEQQPKIDGLVAVTSLYAGNVERQRQCLQSWRDFGLTIASVNSGQEWQSVLTAFDDLVDYWMPCQTTPPTIKRMAMTSQELGTVLLINSDIEIYGKQQRLMDRIKPRTLTMGVRLNYFDDTRDASRERYGIDAFVIAPEMANDLPSLPLRIGRPVWDYWLPLHFRERYRLDVIGNELFFHKQHAMRWSAEDWDVAAEIIANHYHVSLTRENSVEFRESLPRPS